MRRGHLGFPLEAGIGLSASDPLRTPEALTQQEMKAQRHAITHPLGPVAHLLKGLVLR